MHNERIIAAMKDCARSLIEAGHPEDDVYDGMLTVTMGWVLQTEGPRQVAAKLHRLYMQATVLAEHIEQHRDEPAN